MKSTEFLSKTLITFAAAAFMSGCSNQWRESDPGVTDGVVFQLYDEMLISGASGNGLFDTNIAQDLRGDLTSTVYFAESGAAMGPVASVMSFNDVSFLGNSLFSGNLPVFVGDSIFQLGLSGVTVIFVDALHSSGVRYFQLMIKMERGSSVEYFRASSTPGSYDFSSDQFEVFMPLQDGTTLILRTFDLSSSFKDELAGTIKLKAYLLENGQEFTIGQFSVLSGFGGF